jgi:hypothetical protein
MKSVASKAPSAVSDVLDIVIEPLKALEAPADDRRWWRFFLATALFVAAGAALLVPVRVHLSGARSSLAQTIVYSIAAPMSLIVLMIGGLALSFVLVSVLRGRNALAWRDSWLVVNEIAFVKLGLSTFCLGLIVALRGPQSFASSADVPHAMPSLAMLVPDLSTRAASVLGVIDPFNVWVCCLYYLAFRRLFGQSPIPAAAAGFIVGLLPQLALRALHGG